MILRFFGKRVATTAWLAAASLHCSCASVSSGGSDSMILSGASGGATPSTSKSTGSFPTLAFEPTALTVPVLGSSTATVRVSPPNGQTVSFALIGNSLDASLSAAEGVTDASGAATVDLTASSTPTTFSIRASIDRTTVTEVAVQVSEATNGAIDVAAKYRGIRQIDSYTVSVLASGDCTSTTSKTAGRKLTSITTNSLPVRLENVPLTSPIMVVVDGGSTTVHGCAVLRGIPGQTNLAVEVPLDDLPLSLYGQTFDASLSAANGTDSLRDSLIPSAQTIVGALATGKNDLTDLLSAMESSATGSLQQEFVSLRTSSDWDSLVVSAYASVNGSDILRRNLWDWLTRGIALLSTQPTLEVRLNLAPIDYSTPQLSLVRIAGIDAVKQLAMHSVDLAVNTEAADRLNWSATLNFNQATLLDALAWTAASLDAPSVPEQLGLMLTCDEFATTLDQHAVWQNANSRVCTTQCLATLCGTALASMYQRALAAAFGLPTTPLGISASGVVAVNTAAQAVSTSGDWIGAWANGASVVNLSGSYVSQ